MAATATTGLPFAWSCGVTEDHTHATMRMDAKRIMTTLCLSSATTGAGPLLTKHGYVLVPAYSSGIESPRSLRQD